MYGRCLSVAGITMSILLLIGPSAPASAGWQQVTPPADFVDRYGVARHTGCSGAPLAPDTNFSFFYRAGNPRNLVIGFDGGGACWDSQTCLGSVLNGTPVYDTYVNETPAQLDALHGLFDAGQPQNPLADSLQVLIPYCTGDLHIGSNDQEYTLGALTYTIRHRGYDNVIAVLEWLAAYYKNTAGVAPSRVFVAGASAGGYGAYFAYPEIDRRLPATARKRVLSDSAIGIINQDFYNRALAPGGVWRIWSNMPPQLAGAFGAGPNSLPAAINQSLAWSFPAARFGQYTRAFDGVQIFYLNIAKNLNAPQLWTDPTQLFLTSLEWTTRARASMLTSALTTFNYRFYIAAGFGHTVIADEDLYLESSAHGLPLVDWLDDMINRPFLFGGDWKNASCFPNCLP